MSRRIGLISDWFVVRDGLIGAARLPSLARPRQRISAAELFMLLTWGGAGGGPNLMALASRAAPKLLGLDLPGTRPFDSWWLQASVTYTLSGVVAGLLGALCWFHFNDRAERRMQS